MLQTRATELWLALAALAASGCGSAPETNARPEPPPAQETVYDNDFNTCPVFRHWLLLPRVVSRDSVATISVDAFDPDASKAELTFSWAATSGAFSEPVAPATDYSCEASGEQTLTLTARDGDACESDLEIEVNCLSGADSP